MCGELNVHTRIQHNLLGLFLNKKRLSQLCLHLSLCKRVSAAGLSVFILVVIAIHDRL